jgi:hypothetical protein
MIATTRKLNARLQMGCHSYVLTVMPVFDDLRHYVSVAFRVGRLSTTFQPFPLASIPAKSEN